MLAMTFIVAASPSFYLRALILVASPLMIIKFEKFNASLSNLLGMAEASFLVSITILSLLFVFT